MATTQDMAVGFPGQQANMVPATLISRTAEAEVPAGVPVYAGTGDHSCIPDVSGGDFLGISVRDAATDSFAINDSVRIMTIGAIWCEISGATVGDQYSAGSETVTGSRIDQVSGDLALVRLQGTATS